VEISLSLSLSENNNKLEIEPMESLPAGHEVDWPNWRSFNRHREEVGRS